MRCYWERLLHPGQMVALVVRSASRLEGTEPEGTQPEVIRAMFLDDSP